MPAALASATGRMPGVDLGGGGGGRPSGRARRASLLIAALEVELIKSREQMALPARLFQRARARMRMWRRAPRAVQLNYIHVHTHHAKAAIGGPFPDARFSLPSLSANPACYLAWVLSVVSRGRGAW